MTQQTISEYDKQALDFLDKTGTEFEVKFLKHDKYFQDDQDTRDIYAFTFKKGGREFKGKFGQSYNASIRYRAYGHFSNDFKALCKLCKKVLAKGEAVENKAFSVPSAYDVLTCITKNDPGSFDDFCSEFGYDSDSRKAERIYQSVVTEWNEVQKIWSDDEIEMMREIQ